MFTITAIYLFICFCKTLLALRYATVYPKMDVSRSIENVTICQPILSGDPELTQVLTAVIQTLPESRFLWLIDLDDVAAQSIANKLVKSHPHQSIEILLLPPAPQGTNPKLFKLEAGRARVETPFIVVLDDDTQLSRKSMQALLDGLEHGELVTGLPYYLKGDNLVSNLLGQFVNNNSAQVYLSLLHFVRPISINGMCYALRMQTLNEAQGFQTILTHLTDDLAVAEMINVRGGRIIQTPLIQEVGTSIQTIVAYLLQMHRWSLFTILLMRRQSIGLNVLIAFLHGVPPLLLLAACASTAIAPTVQNFISLCLLLTIRGVLLCTVQQNISGKVRHSPLLSIVSELLQPFHLIHAFCWRRIKWRSRQYRVFDNDRFESL